MYQKIKKWIAARDKDLFTYLCMESKAMWDNVYDFIPENPKQLGRRV